MKQILKDFGWDMLRQLLGWSAPREGKLILTLHAYQKMRQYQLDEHTIADVFYRGEEVRKDTIIRKYYNYSVGIIVKPAHRANQFVIITCWKGGVKHG